MSDRFVMYTVCVHSALYTVRGYLSIPLKTTVYKEILPFQIQKYIAFSAKYKLI